MSLGVHWKVSSISDRMGFNLGCEVFGGGNVGGYMEGDMARGRNDGYFMWNVNWFCGEGLGFTWE